MKAEAVSVFNYAEKGRNILDRGTDVYKGSMCCKKRDAAFAYDIVRSLRRT
jgi:predicted membrane GTPase involved in stress response